MMNSVNTGQHANKADIYKVNKTDDAVPHTSARSSPKSVQSAEREGRISPVKCGLVFC